MTTKKKKKIKKKFRRNILIGVIALFIVAFIINTAPGYRRNKYANITNLVIMDENITEELTHKIYINDKGTVYIAKDDISHLMDKSIYYDEGDNTIIITQNATIASMKIGEKEIKINGANVSTLDTIIYLENTMYIPISELESVYNISVKYIKESDVVVIDVLNRSLTTAEVNEKTKLKFRPRGLSKTLEQLPKGERIYAFETTSKGWRLIRTEEGVIGYVKAEKLANEYEVRQDMENENKALTKKVKANLENENVQEIDGKNIVIQDLFTLSNDGVVLKKSTIAEENENMTVWGTVSNDTELDLRKYETRSKLIDEVVKLVYKYKLKGINVNIDLHEEGNQRFIIELAPRLKEMGIITNIITTERVEEESYRKVVEYIITKE